MRLARLTQGFADFLQTPAARSAPQWQIEQLADTRWPANAEPTARQFVGLLSVFATSQSDRQTA